MAIGGGRRVRGGNGVGGGVGGGGGGGVRGDGCRLGGGGRKVGMREIGGEDSAADAVACLEEDDVRGVGVCAEMTSAGQACDAGADDDDAARGVGRGHGGWGIAGGGQREQGWFWARGRWEGGWRVLGGGEVWGRGVHVVGWRVEGLGGGWRGFLRETDAAAGWRKVAARSREIGRAHV